MSVPSRVVAVGLLAVAGLVASVVAISRSSSPPQQAWQGLHAPPDASDIFPLEGPLRVFDTHDAPGVSQGVLVFERSTGGRERLGNGEEYVVTETRVLNRGTGARRVVSREWLVRTPDGVFCGKRQEGPLVAILEPPQPVVLLPLTTGRRWEWEGLAGGRRCRLTGVVSASERVSVGAGTFEDAWRIDSEIVSDDPPKTLIRRSFWLESGIGLIEEKARVELGGRTLELDATLRTSGG
jgi:hypothetical protein